MLLSLFLYILLNPCYKWNSCVIQFINLDLVSINTIISIHLTLIKHYYLSFSLIYHYLYCIFFLSLLYASMYFKEMGRDADFTKLQMKDADFQKKINLLLGAIFLERLRYFCICLNKKHSENLYLLSYYFFKKALYNNLFNLLF